MLVGVRTGLKIDAIPRCDRTAVCDFLRRVTKNRTEEMKTVVEDLTEEERKRVKVLLSIGTKKKVVKSIELGFSDWYCVCWDECRSYLGMSSIQLKLSESADCCLVNGVLIRLHSSSICSSSISLFNADSLTTYAKKNERNVEVVFY